MFRTAFAILTVMAILISGCGSSAQPVAKPTQPAAKPTQAAGGSLLINGAGATFPFPLYSRWFYEYAQVDKSAKFNYQSIGSGGGIKQIKEETVDFAGSDAILSEKDYQEVSPNKLQMLPVVAGAVVPCYNLLDQKGREPVVLDGLALADIFLGKIKKWNDPALAALNPGVNLPSKDVIVVHRSDGSGTTSIFTDYLASVSMDWKTRVGSGTSVKWPVGLGGKGNEGVAGMVMQNDGSIGYAELAFAKQNSITFASMKNAAGTVVTASTRGAQSAMSDFGGAMPETLARSIVNPTGRDSWPIAGYTYLLVYMDQQDCTKAPKLVQFVKWALSEKGSSIAMELDYVPPPDNVKQQVLDTLGKMTCQGKPF